MRERGNLNGMTASARPTADDAVQTAKRRFQSGGRIDMSALAEDLGVNRVTLYRWFGSRDLFLVEVIWGLARSTLDVIAAEVKTEGADRIVDVVTGFLDAVITNAGMQRWLAEEANKRHAAC